MKRNKQHLTALQGRGVNRTNSLDKIQQQLNYEMAEEDVTSSTEGSDESVEVDMERLSRIPGAYTQEIRERSR